MNMGSDARRKLDISDENKGHSFHVKMTQKKVCEAAKHLRSAFRLYQCSRFLGCSGMDRDFGK